jgi:hypothetical protein
MKNASHLDVFGFPRERIIIRKKKKKKKKEENIYAVRGAETESGMILLLRIDKIKPIPNIGGMSWEKKICRSIFIQQLNPDLVGRCHWLFA